MCSDGTPFSELKPEYFKGCAVSFQNFLAGISYNIDNIPHYSIIKEFGGDDRTNHHRSDNRFSFPIEHSYRIDDDFNYVCHQICEIVNNAGG